MYNADKGKYKAPVMDVFALTNEEDGDGDGDSVDERDTVSLEPRIT